MSILNFRVQFYAFLPQAIHTPAKICLEVVIFSAIFVQVFLFLKIRFTVFV